MQLRRTLVVALLVSLSLAATAHAGVLTVSGSGAADFTQISAAVAAAQDGDLILVEPSGGLPYSAFTIDGKSLVISIAHDNVPVGTRPITIKNIAGGQSCLLRGFTVSAVTTPMTAGVSIEQCAGSVRLEDCTLTGTSPVVLGNGGRAGLAATASSDVGLMNCTLNGGAGASSGTNDWNASPGGPALLLSASTCWAHFSQLHGGTGGSHFDPDLIEGDNYQVGNGGAGAQLLAGSTLTVAGSVLTGGTGGVQIVSWSYSQGGAGVLMANNCLLRERDNSLIPGTGTQKHYLTPPILGDPTDVDSLHTPARLLLTDSPRREFETLHLSINGEPGDLAMLVFAFGPHGQWKPPLQGPLLVDPLGAALIVLGPVPGSGSLAVPFAVPGLPAASEHIEAYLQLVIGQQGHVTLENGSAVVLLDASL